MIHLGNNGDSGRRRLYFLMNGLYHNMFSGYGLSVEDERKDHLVGLLIVDRPYRVDPRWLDDVKARYGGYDLVPMTYEGDRGIACEMHIASTSLDLVQEQPGRLSELITDAIGPMLHYRPKPRFKMRWTGKYWVSEFY